VPSPQTPKGALKRFLVALGMTIMSGYIEELVGRALPSPLIPFVDNKELCHSEQSEESDFITYLKPL